MTVILAHTADWLLTWFVHASVACAVALLTGRWLSGDKSRDLLWKTALLLPLATSLLSVSMEWSPGGSLDVPTTARRFMPRSLQAAHVSVQAARPSAPATITVRDDTARAVRYAVLAMMLLPAVIATSRMVSRQRRYRSVLRGRRVVSARNLGVDVDALSPGGHTVRLSVSSRVESAAAVGHGEICVSDTLTSLGRAQREAVIAHELAHVERRDVLWSVFADAVGCLLAVQPLVRIVVRRFRRDAEFICDDIAVRRTGDARAYVGTLILFATPYDNSAGALAYGSSPIVERAERLLNSHRARGQSHVWVPSLIAVMLLCGLLALPRVHTGDANVTVRTQDSSTTSTTRKQVHVTLGGR